MIPPILSQMRLVAFFVWSKKFLILLLPTLFFKNWIKKWSTRLEKYLHRRLHKKFRDQSRSRNFFINLPNNRFLADFD
nr:MAG TPA: hypothetical protein [Caudoviricetes sp.]